MADKEGTDVTDAKPDLGKGRGEPRFPPIPSGPGQIMMTQEEFLSDEYKMNYPQRGRAIIINNRDFNRELNLGPRTGTDQDAAALHQRFTEMGFDVNVYTNVTADNMFKVLMKAASDNEYNKLADCFVCAILTHGEEGVVFGIDNKIETKQLMEPFKGTNCAGLVGKPKIFFIQACQGSQFDSGVPMDMADAKGDRRDQIQVHKIPSEADFLIAYSVVPGYFSWRNSAQGSWFIQALSEVLARHWRDMDLLTIMTRVNKKVAFDYESRTGKEFMNQKKQIPCVTSMLTKEVVFRPKPE